MMAAIRTTTLDLSSATNDQSNALEGWDWKSSTKTLTLTDVNFNVATGSAIKLPENATIEVNGTNQISCATEDTIYGTVSLRIDGIGIMNIASAKSGIYSNNGDISVLGSTIVIDKASNGLYSDGKTTISGGSITVKDVSYGIYSKSDLEIKNSSVTVEKSGSDAIYALGFVDISNATIDIGNALNGISAPNKGKSLTIYPDSVIMIDKVEEYGLYAHNGSTGRCPININGGDITINEAGASGIIASDVNISGGSILLGHAKDNGLLATYGIEISGGTVQIQRTDNNGLCVDNGNIIVKGSSSITLGNIANNGFDASRDIKISGGTIHIQKTGRNGLYANFHGISLIEISGGSIVIDEAGVQRNYDAIGSRGSLNISDGEITINKVANGHAIYSQEDDLTISGGKINIGTVGASKFGITTSWNSITISGGTIDMTSPTSIGIDSGKFLYISNAPTINGDISNNGTFTVNAQATFTNKGMFVNDGSVLYSGHIIDEGTYTGSGSVFNDGTSGSIKPKITVTPASASVSVDALVTLTATVSFKQPTALTWYKKIDAMTTTQVWTGSTYTPDTSARGDETYFCENITSGLVVSTKSADVTVTVVHPAVTGVSLSPGTVSVLKGGSQQFTATVSVQDGASQTADWSVNSTLSSIDNAGKLTVGANETANTLTVTATSTFDSTQKATATVTVLHPAVTGVSLNPGTASVLKGDSQQFTATVNIENGAPQTTDWSVNSTLSSIDNTGKLTVGANETANTLTVTATSTFDNTKKATATVTVLHPAVTGVSLNPGTASVLKGDSQQFTATVNIENGAPKTVNWSVDSKLSSIDNTGKLTVGANETANTLTVTATSTFDNTKKATATVTVTTPIPVVYPLLSPFGTFTGNGSLSATIDAPHEKFLSLSLGGKPLDKTHYSTQSGSTVITLNEAYLKTLPNSQYTLHAAFTDGSAELPLTVAVPAKSPQTGDTLNLWPLLALAAAALLGGGAAVLVKLRGEKKGAQRNSGK